MSVQTAQPLSLWGRYVGGAGLTVTLAAFLVLSVAYPIQDARWVENMAPLALVGVLGVGYAALASGGGLSPLRAHLSAALLGAVVVFVSALAMTPGGLLDRVPNLFSELRFWIEGIPTDEIRGGLVEFAIFLTAVTWALGYLAGWMALRRRQGWVAVLLGGAVLSIALVNLSSGSTGWLLLFMMASILLLIHMATSRRMVGWRARRLAFEPATVLSQSGFILGAGVLITLAVFPLPRPVTAPLGFVVDAFEAPAEAAEEHFSRLFNGLPSRREFRTLAYGPTTQFQGNPNLTDELLFTVTGREPGYWRARTYTTYTSTGWESVGAEYSEFVLPEEPERQRVSVRHGYRIVAATATLFSSGVPEQFDQPVEALAYADAPGDALQVRTIEGREFFAVRTGLRYESVGSESRATPAQLRAASADYPAWVAERYLQLPDTLPQRVRDLAFEIAGSHATVYDQIEAIRGFVISFPYNLNIVAPPAGSDGVDYFLFDLRQGYCDYYASATAVMLRALGIPSRYVLGYASGQWDPSSRSYQVLDLNYHSWVEAYFPEYGWVPFEATPPDGIEFGGRRTELPPLGVGSQRPDPGDNDGIPEGEEEELVPLGPVGGGGELSINTTTVGIAIGSALFLAVAALYYQWWLRLARLSRPDELYAKLRRMASLLGVPAKPEETPMEFAASLAKEMPDNATDFYDIARAYGGRRYSDRPIPMTELRRAEEAWSRLRWVLILRLFRAPSPA